MAISAANKLTLLPFPQQWDSGAGTISLRVIVLPRGNPLDPLTTGVPLVADGPAFADANVRIKALLIPGLGALPSPAATTTEVSLGTVTPPGMRALYEELAAQFVIDPTLETGFREPRRAGRQILKYLPGSYRTAFPYSGPRTPFAVTDDRYHCALRDGCRLKKDPGPPPDNRTVWGRIIALALRQPLLAEALGLLYRPTLTLPAPGDMYLDGGWLYLGLEAAGDYADAVTAQPTLLSFFAARIPPLASNTGRVLFAPVLFPVANVPPPGNYDEIQAEAAAYDDGFAHIVHSAQKVTSDPTGLDTGTTPPITDAGVQLGWDDEQLLIWQNRQISDPAADPRNAPLGVRGYRVDVREHGVAGPWRSLTHVDAELAVGEIGIGHFDGELAVEVTPLQLDNEEDGNYWMPVFFTQWRGKSLMTADSVGSRLSGVAEEDLAEETYTPVGEHAVPLRYGHTYDFRVRFCDISCGGPGVGADAANPSPAPVSTTRFLRHVPPATVLVDGVPKELDPDAPPAELRVSRPRLAYPAAVFADIPDAEALLLDDAAALIAASAAGTTTGGEPSLPDPDVAILRITVSASALTFDTGNSTETPPLRTLYTAEFAFPDDPATPIVLALDYVDVPDAETLIAPPDGDPLPIPTGRDVVLTFTPIGKEDVDLKYFGSQEARIGRTFDAQLRATPTSEEGIFALDSDAARLRAILLRPDEAPTASLLAKLIAEGKAVEAENDPVFRLAAELGLHADGAALAGRTGRRVVFGCSAAMAHILAPDGSSITFSSKADLVRRWITVLTVVLNRDWTWRNSPRPAFDIALDGKTIGSITLPDAVNPRVCEIAQAAGQEPDRATTTLLYFDAIDPKPVPPAFPHGSSHTYTITPRFKDVPGAEDPPLSASIDLPIASPPTQTPKLVGAGIALSEYRRADDYSSTEQRARMLWIEIEAAPENARDGLFGRVLSYSPDPMLTRLGQITVPPEPPLPIDPELVRVIRPGQSDDHAGLDAMQALIPTTSPTHFLLPLPPDMTRDSRELFGFFVYELRIQHLDWSTAQDRPGPALRVAGVQHPSPQLFCNSLRTPESILASAPYATPVFAGRSMLPPVPTTRIWFLLYAQVIQADGKDYRNILLGRRRGTFREQKIVTRVETDLSASGQWSQAEIVAALDAYGLPLDSPLSVLAVELLPEAEQPSDPLGASLGEVRILRTSPLVKLSDVCIQPPCAVAS